MEIVREEACLSEEYCLFGQSATNNHSTFVFLIPVFECPEDCYDFQ